MRAGIREALIITYPYDQAAFQAVLADEPSFGIRLQDAVQPEWQGWRGLSTSAERPHYSVLDKTSTFAILGRPTPHWRVNLRKMLAEIKTHD